jgi:AcrR family transcriptional regulator
VGSPVNETKRALMDATAVILGTEGLSAISARTVAGRAGVNQALVFYHFDSVSGLIEQTCRARVEASVPQYRHQLAAVGSLTDLLTLGRVLHARETELGNVAIMAQLMAGAQGDERLRSAARYAIDAWIAEIEPAVARLLAGSPVAEAVDPAGLARAISAGFLGLELYDGVDPEGAGLALGGLEQLGLLVDVVDDLGPVARRALRARVRRHRQNRRT